MEDHPVTSNKRCISDKTLVVDSNCPAASVSKMKDSKMPFNSLPNDKILHKSKFKAFADDKINVTKKLKSDW